MNPNFIYNFKKIKNYLNINNKANLIVVTKNQSVEKINDLINEGHRDFGENKVQEAKSKWTNILKINPKLKFIATIIVTLRHRAQPSKPQPNFTSQLLKFV